ncbi:response regulator [Hasllibacter halocynthiae]|uniref:response regulator n=1 Tax=Hasllibacter halocynthiae TaxID=595589 RepID=UPI0013047FFA|nr:response regulator [Hasllibacter halocynthiae]
MGGIDRVLIVEDELLIALDVELTLQAAGYEVVGTAAREDEAVAMALEARPDLMVVDLRLADGGSGRRVAERVRAEIDVALVFASGNLDPAMRASLLPLDPLATLSKPYDATELLRVIAAA